VKQDFQVEVRGDHIIVTFVGTSFCVNYPKPKKGQALLPSGFSKPAEATSAQVAGFIAVAPRQRQGQKARLDARQLASFTTGWPKRQPPRIN